MEIASQVDCKHLIELNLLPMMYFFKLADIMFLVNSLKNPTAQFNILHYMYKSKIKAPTHLTSYL